MRVTNTLTLLLFAAVISKSAFADVAIQQPGTNYLILEAEEFVDEDLNDELTGWLIIGPDSPAEIELHSSNPGTIMVPPPSSNPSGGLAIIDQAGGGDFVDQILYGLQFETAGTYYLYTRYSLFDLRDLINPSYGNEDSIYLPVESLDQDPADEFLRSSRDGHTAFTKDIDGVTYGPLDGCRDIDEPWVIPDEECDADGLRGDEQFEGQYHWTAANWGNDLGHANYVVDATGTVLDFSIASRERGASLDVMIFSQDPDLTPADLDALLGGDGGGNSLDFDGDGSLGLNDVNLLLGAVAQGVNNALFDVNKDGNVDPLDINSYIGDADKLNTYIGDANLDGEFNSGDFVAVFQGGLFETEGAATWETGDWNGDGRFNSGDFVAAFQDGGFELGPKGATSAVPEPSSVVLLLVGSLAVMGRRRR